VTVTVRAVRPEEHEVAGRVVVAAYEALPGETMSGGYAAELADVRRRATGAEVLVAVDGAGEVLGCVTFVPDRRSPWAEMVEEGESAIRMLAVSPTAQGQGIGDHLLQACLSRARELGRSAVFLHSTPWMTSAHRLYERAGFTRVPERDWQPVPEVPLWAFRLDLGTAH
jgi:ribosomal protein S18 acetylase RimI-like enzyme